MYLFFTLNGSVTVDALPQGRNCREREIERESHDDVVTMTGIGTHLDQAVPQNEVEGNANGQKQVKYRRLDSERREGG